MSKIKKLLAKAAKIGSVSSLRPIPRRPRVKKLVLGFAAVLLTYNIVQVIQSTLRTVEGISRLVQLTYIDADVNNQDNIGHPYYTICPILSSLANLDDPEATLVSVMAENSFYHSLVNFVPVLNSAKLGATERYTTWVKMPPYNKGQKDSLVLCYTFDVPHNVTLGQTDGFVNMLLFGKSLTEIRKQSTFVKEFRVFIHEREGFVNTFMLNGGRPQIIVPGLDQKLQIQKPQQLHYVIKSRKKELTEDKSDCDPSPRDDCFEDYLQTTVMANSCLIPWKKPGQRSPCPPCNWQVNDKTTLSKTCPDLNVYGPYRAAISQRFNDSACHYESPESYNCTFDANLEYDIFQIAEMLDGCLVCDKQCQIYPLEALCRSRQHLTDIADNLPIPGDTEALFKGSGCKLPCSYIDYDVTELEASSVDLDMSSYMDFIAFLTLELSTDDVETFKEVQADSWLQFAGKVNGNIGMFFGFSIFHLTYARDESVISPRREVAGMLLFASAFSWSISNYNRFSENRIRQENVLQQEDQEVETRQQIPYLTFCPVFLDSIYWPIRGFKNKELTFEKYNIVQQKTFLIKNYQYKGRWRTKWNVYRHNLFQSQVYGQQCYTYIPDGSESNKIVLRLDRKNIQVLRGFTHQHDTLQSAFLHKSSQAKFTIPYNDPRYQLTPNVFSFVIKPRTLTDTAETDCDKNIDIDSQTEDCFAEHLQRSLGCILPWDISLNSSTCPICQTPFKENGSSYWECTGDKAIGTQKWCSTATLPNASTVPDSWQFCYSDCQHKPENAMCKSREALENLTDNFFDRSRMNPRKVAAELKGIGCPFSCQYADYGVEIVYKKIDTAIDPDVLQLTFHLDGRSSWQTTVKSLDYSYDMLVSDYGAIFGLLVGLSLIDTITFLLAALKAFLQDLFKRQQIDRNRKLRRCYELTKWLLVTCLIGLLIFLMFSADFRSLDIFLPADTAAATQDESEFLNPTYNSERGVDNKSISIIWGPEVSGREHLVSCPFKEEVGDGWCDDKANVEECFFDGNDCCKVGKELMPNAHLFCHDCSCHMGGIMTKRRKPGLCEICHFPFRHHIGLFNDRITDDCTFAGFDEEGKVDYICTPAVYSGNLMGLGIPYDWICPRKEPHEFRPTCFLHDKQNATCIYGGNGYCNRMYNNPGCDFDSGDCCLESPDCDDYCSEEECFCHVTGRSHCHVPCIIPDFLTHEHFSDGECDGYLNTNECSYDGGDCCLEESNCRHCDDRCVCHETGLSHCTSDPEWDKLLIDLANCTSNIDYLSDSYCDFELNNNECLFDGGDCCLEKSNCINCDNCICHETGLSHCAAVDIDPNEWEQLHPDLVNCTIAHHNSHFFSDGFCDSESDFNNRECLYDGGDCCLENANCKYCDSCICHKTGVAHCTASDADFNLDEWEQVHADLVNCTSDANTDYFSDGICDSDLNNQDCLFDGGDCCDYCTDENNTGGSNTNGTCELQEFMTHEHFSDGHYCDGYLNTYECSYDGGDCCLEEPNCDYCGNCICHATGLSHCP